MTKDRLNTYFTTNNKEIMDYIKNIFFKSNLRTEDPGFFMTECYLYMLKRLDKIEDEEMLKKFISTFLYNNTRWANSSVREMGTIKKQNKLVAFDPAKRDTEDEEVDLFNEGTGIDYKALNELYYQSLSTLEEKAVWEIYFLQGCSTFVKFGKHIGRSKSVGDKYITWLRNDLRRFLKEYKEKNGICQ